MSSSSTTLTDEESKQQLLFDTAQQLSLSIANVSRLSGANFKQGVADLTVQCRSALKVFGINQQIENDLTNILKSEVLSALDENEKSESLEGKNASESFVGLSAQQSTTNDAENNNSKKSPASKSKLQWTILTQELRSLKRKYPQQEKSIPAVLHEKQMQQAQSNSSGSNSYSSNHSAINVQQTIDTLLKSNKYVLPSVDTELGQVIQNSFGVIHFFVDAASVVKEFGPKALSQLLVLNEPSLRREALEWMKNQNEESNQDDDETDESSMTKVGQDDANTSEKYNLAALRKKKAREIENQLRTLFYSEMSKNDLKKKMDADDLNANDENNKVVVNQDTTKALLLSREWLKVDSALLLNNGSFLRHPHVSDFFQSPPSLLSSYRQQQQQQQQGSGSAVVDSVMEDVRMFRERKLSTKKKALPGNLPQMNQQPQQQHQQQPLQQDSAAANQQKQHRDDQEDIPVIPIRFVGSSAVASVLDLVAKVS